MGIMNPMLCGMELGPLSLMNAFAFLNYCSFCQKAKLGSEFISKGIKSDMGQNTWIPYKLPCSLAMQDPYLQATSSWDPKLYDP